MIVNWHITRTDGKQVRNQNKGEEHCHIKLVFTKQGQNKRRTVFMGGWTNQASCICVEAHVYNRKENEQADVNR